jgi:tetratricopeptide (TPR) repeat protein
MRGARLNAWVSGTFALAVTASAAGPAGADTPPSMWERAKDPSLEESYRLHVEVQRRLAQKSSRYEIGAGDSQLRTVRALLERYKAEESKDPQLRFDLGFVYLRLEEYDKSAKTLAGVLADAPNHPAAEEGWLRLAFACGHTGDHECERRAYRQVLRLATDELSRATPTLNLAETEMHLGNLREAAEGYREALRIAGRVPSRETAPLAVWGLAVALDRSGDRLGAEKEARFACELERSMGIPNLLRTDIVFFVPAYEIHWYEGLGASAQARNATTPRETVRLWRAAEQSFANYVRFAEIDKDRWLDLAKLRLATVKSEREKAEKKQGKQPAREPADDDPDLP